MVVQVVLETISRPVHKCKLPRLKMTTRPSVSRKNIDNRNCAANAEVMLSSFASLLSSAVTNGVEHPLLSSDDPTLSRLLTNDPTNNEKIPILSFSGLSLKNGHRNRANHPNHQNYSSTTFGNNNSSSSPSSIQDVAANSLATPVTANLSTIDSIPSQLLQNLTGSLKRLIDSRMRSSFAALLRTMQGGLDDSIMRLLLVTLDPIRITTVVTSFTVVTSSSGETQSRRSSAAGNPHSINNSVTLPLILEAIIDAKVLSKMVNLTLHAPGTITGTINPTNMLLTSVNVAFDTMALLKSMMSQARVIVKKGIREAAYLRASFRKNAELNGIEGLINYNRSLQNFQQSLPQNERGNNDSISNPTSQQNTNLLLSRKPTASSTMQEKLLTSYPNHLRQTVEHFLPAIENSDSVSIEGFPSHLAKTLLSLSKPGSSPSHSSGNEGADGERNLNGSIGGNSSQSSNEEGMQDRYPRQNDNSKQITNNNALINRGGKSHYKRPHEESWTQNVQSSSTAIENNNNNCQQYGSNSVPAGGGLSLSHPGYNGESPHDKSADYRIHKEHLSQKPGKGSQEKLSTDLHPSSNDENKTGTRGCDISHLIDAHTVTEHQTPIQRQHPPQSKRQRTGNAVDDSYAERTI